MHNFPCSVHAWSQYGGLNVKQSILVHCRPNSFQHIMACQTNQYKNSQLKFSHQFQATLTEHGKFCMQNNQLQAKSPVESKDKFISTTSFFHFLDQDSKYHKLLGSKIMFSTKKIASFWSFFDLGQQCKPLKLEPLADVNTLVLPDTWARYVGLRAHAFFFFHIQAQLLLIQHKILTSCRFKDDSSQMTCFRLIRDL